MSFIVNEPQATELMSVSQGILNTNNGILAAAFAKDHDALTDADALARGKHTYVRLIEQTPPVAATLADEGGLYVSDADDSLYFKPPNDGTPVKIGSTVGGGTILATASFTFKNAVADVILFQTNIASITSLGGGQHQIVFTNALPSANYCVTGSRGDNVGGTSESYSFAAHTQTVNGFRISIANPSVLLTMSFIVAG